MSILSRIRSMFGLKWVSGRQGTGYDKMILVPAWLSEKFKFDLVLIRMTEGIEIPTHIDPVPCEMIRQGFIKHVRVNIIIIKPSDGGDFCLNSTATKKRINIFSPSHTPHSVTMIKGGSRLVLSCGWLRK